MEQEHHDQAAGDIIIKFIVRIKADTNHTINQNKLQEADECATDKPKILTNHGENHI